MFSQSFRPLVPTFALVCFASGSLHAKPTSAPKELLEQSLHEVISIAEKERGASPVQLSKRVRPTLEKIFNFESLAKRAVGSGWKELTPDQQKQASLLFSEMLIRSYAARFDWDNKIDIQFSSPVEIGNGKIEVPSSAKYEGNNVAVVYRMEPMGNAWSVYDVVIEGVSMTSNYRAQFDAIRQKSGGDGLLKSMQENLKP